MRVAQIQNAIPVILTLVIIAMVLTLGTYGFHSLAKTSSAASQDRFWSALQSSASSYSSYGSLKSDTLSLPAGEFLCAFDTSVPVSERRCDGFNAELCRQLQSYWLAAGPQDDNVVLSTGEHQRINGLSFGDSHYACVQGPQARVFFIGQGTSASLSPYVPVSVTRQGNGETISVGSSTPNGGADVVTATGPAFAYDGVNVQNTITFTAQPVATGNVVAATARAIDLSQQLGALSPSAKYEPSLTVSITNPSGKPVEINVSRTIPSWIAQNSSDLGFSIPPDAVTRTAEGLNLSWKNLLIPPGGLAITISGSSPVDSSTIKSDLGSVDLTPQVAIAYPPRILGLTASPSTVEPGGSFTLSYTIENMIGNCTGDGLAEGIAIPPSGLTRPITVPASAKPDATRGLSVGIMCTNPAGTARNSTKITIVGCSTNATCGAGHVCVSGSCRADPLAPRIEGFSVSKRLVSVNEGFTLSYDIVNANSSDCHGVGILAGLGPIPVPSWGSGALYFNSTDSLGSHLVGIVCTTAHGTANASAMVTLVGSSCLSSITCPSGEGCQNGRCVPFTSPNSTGTPPNSSGSGTIVALVREAALVLNAARSAASANESMRPVVGVNVSAQGTGRSCVTGSNGSCVLTPLPFGTYRVAFAKQGYEAAVRTVRIDAVRTARTVAVTLVAQVEQPQPRMPAPCSNESGPVCGLPPSSCVAGEICTQQLNAPRTYTNTCALESSGAEYLYPGACRNTTSPTEPNCADPTPVCGTLGGVRKTFDSNCALVAAGGVLDYKGPCSSSVGYDVALSVTSNGLFHSSTTRKFVGTLDTGGSANVTVRLEQSMINTLFGGAQQCSFTARVANDGGTISCEALESLGDCTPKILMCSQTPSKAPATGVTKPTEPSSSGTEYKLSVSSNVRARVNLYGLLDSSIASATGSGGVSEVVGGSGSTGGVGTAIGGSGGSGGVAGAVGGSTGSNAAGHVGYSFISSCFTPCTFTEPEGVYHLTASADGYNPSTKTVNVSSNVPVRFTLGQQILTYKATLRLSRGIFGTQSLVKTGELAPGGQQDYTHYYSTLFGNSCMLKVRVENKGGTITCAKIDGWGSCTARFTCEQTGIANPSPPAAGSPSSGSSSSSSSGGTASKICGATSCVRIGSCSTGQQQEKCTCSYSGAVSYHAVSCSPSSGSSSNATAFCDQPQNYADPSCHKATAFCDQPQNYADPSCRTTSNSSNATRSSGSSSGSSSSSSGSSSGSSSSSSSSSSSGSSSSGGLTTAEKKLLE